MMCWYSLVKIRKLISLIIVLAAAVSCFSQMARKPSPSRAGSEDVDLATTAKRFLPELNSRDDFDRLARVYNAKTPYALPHLMFIIDRHNNDKIYYVNSQMFRFHQDFANAEYLSLKRGEDFFRDVYTN